MIVKNQNSTINGCVQGEIMGKITKLLILTKLIEEKTEVKCTLEGNTLAR